MKIERFENRKPKFHIGIGKWFSKFVLVSGVVDFMSLALVNKIHHLEQQVQYLVAETEKLRDEMIGLKANRRVAALEINPIRQEYS